MACFHPIQAWQTYEGDVVFVERGKIRRELKLSCGRCIGCRMRRSRSWAIRCVHESKMFPISAFVTLTYDDDHYSPSLDYRDFQLFMKRLVKFRGPTRFYCCGEYGEDKSRPHFHALLFGCWFDDAKPWTEGLYRSSRLEKLWPMGHSSFGHVSYQSAAYVARYTCQKVTGPLAAAHYERVHLSTGEIVSVRPELGHMSLKNGGLGYSWFQKFWRDVYLARDGIVVDGKVLPPPKYYDKLLAESMPVLSSDKDFERYLNSVEFAEDCTPERLAVREQVEIARLNTFKRSL